MSRTNLCVTSIALLLAACGGRALSSDEDFTDETTGGGGASTGIEPTEGGAGGRTDPVGEAGREGEDPFNEGGEGGETGGRGVGGRPATGGVSVGGVSGGGASVGGSGASVGGEVPVAGGSSGGLAGGGTASGGVSPTGGTAGAIATGGTAGAIATGGTAGTVGGTGGRPIYIGGAPVGGSIVGGGGAVGGEAPEPENCEVQYENGSPSEGYCEINLACDNDYVYTYCWEEGAGSWYCDCGTNYFYQSYQTTGGTEAPCSAVAEICIDADSPAFTAPEVCTPSYASAGSGYCEVQQDCSRTAELGDGISAVERRSEYTYCYDYGEGYLRCDCSADGAYASYAIDGDPSVDQCRRVLDLCGTPAPEGEGTITCDPAYDYWGSDYCQAEQNCTARIPVSDGVDVVYSNYENAYCQSAADGTINCSCSSIERSLRFDIEGDTEDSAVCWTSLEVCRDPAPLELSGSPTCTRSYQSAYSGACDAQITCSQPASVGELDLIAYGDVHTYCTADGADGLFTCQCSSGQVTVAFEVEGADEWEVCSLAVGRCPDLVEVQYEGTSYGYGGGFGGIGPVPVD